MRISICWTIWSCSRTSQRIRRVRGFWGPVRGKAKCKAGEMRQENQRTRWLATAGLAVAMAISVPFLARGGPMLAPQQKHAAAPPPPHQSVRPQGHAGDWLRRYKDLPPAEQERELQNDPAFRRLSPERQQRLRQRLQHFSSLPPQQQLQMLNRMETWEHLTPEQKQQARQIFGQMRQLPPDRRHMVMTAMRDLRGMPPDQREGSSIQIDLKGCSPIRSAR